MSHPNEPEILTLSSSTTTPSQRIGRTKPLPHQHSPSLSSNHHAAVHHHHHHSSSHRYHSKPAIRTHIEIGADDRPTEKMQGVQDHSAKPPLVVLDGANVAYAYSQTMMETQSPNVRGIRVAVEYFLNAHLRVLVVLPMSWMTRKPDSYYNNVVEEEGREILENLKQRGLLVAAPPTDDDDAYAIMIARKETKAPAYILSNVLFRDAQQRHPELTSYLNNNNGELGSGRISYAFCRFGRLDDHGEEELDLVPNPRHPLVLWIEEHRRHR